MEAVADRVVLQDNTFKPLTRVSSWEGRSETLKRARLASWLNASLGFLYDVVQYVAFSVGIIRGALSRMDLHGTDTPEIASPPHCMTY